MCVCVCACMWLCMCVHIVKWYEYHKHTISFPLSLSHPPSLPPYFPLSLTLPLSLSTSLSHSPSLSPSLLPSLSLTLPLSLPTSLSPSHPLTQVHCSVQLTRPALSLSTMLPCSYMSSGGERVCAPSRVLSHGPSTNPVTLSR